MTNWVKYGSTLEIRHQYVNTQKEFLETLPGNVDDEPLWEVDEDDEIQPISHRTDRPQPYIERYLDIIKWLKKKRLNVESGYAFTYVNEEDPDDRLVGAINSNNEGVTFFQIDGDGKVTQQFYRIQKHIVFKK